MCAGTQFCCFATVICLSPFSPCLLLVYESEVGTCAHVSFALARKNFPRRDEVLCVHVLYMYTLFSANREICLGIWRFDWRYCKRNMFAHFGDFWLATRFFLGGREKLEYGSRVDIKIRDDDFDF